MNKLHYACITIENRKRKIEKGKKKIKKEVP